uniref:Endonuclease/exonuclease/phosphatase domain-containing protein n=1 Tax=Oryzias latipes TaxID=8090 RepID=A0A3P9HYI8_ORYLA
QRHSSTGTNLTSLNVRGLNNNIKRVKCQQLMHRQKADVVLIQESHLRQGDVSKIQDKQYKVISSSSSSSKSKGVIIVFKRNLPTKIEKTYSDNLGRDLNRYMNCVLFCLSMRKKRLTDLNGNTYGLY